MIKCIKCKTLNPLDSMSCIKCSSDLLPAPPLRDRTPFAIIGLSISFLALVLSILLLVKVIPVPYVDPESTLYWIRPGIILLFALPFTLLCAILIIKESKHEPSLDEKLLYRAIRHVNIDREQAESDFREAIRLTDRWDYYQRRGLFYEKIGLLDEADTDYRTALTKLPDKVDKKIIINDISRIGKLRGKK